jgi:hypothetical protein
MKYCCKVPTKRFFIIIAVIAVMSILIRTAGPYIFVANSIPGQAALSDKDSQSLLNETVQRVKHVGIDRQHRILSIIAIADMDKHATDNRDGIVSLARIILANFSLNQNIDPCNQLLRKMVVWGKSGSSWQFHKTGDYDFAAVWMTTILYEFGKNEKILYPETREYLLNVLLPDQGKLDLKVPRTLGLVFDTENHLLMREGSRYLKNQWLKSQGNTSARYDNKRNGLGQWLERYLNHMRLHGPYEYNSVPYLSYSILPLMNLADYAESGTIRKLAESILDDNFYRFAYGSLNLKQCAPFRRQFEYAQSQSLELNRCRSLVRFWQDENFNESGQLELAAVVHGYTLPVSTYTFFEERKDEDYYKIFPHDQKGSPEIYSGGKHYLLSAGGAYRGKNAKVIPRPAALLLDDNARELKDCIHIKGQGDWKLWNMTGVHRRFAVAKGTVFVPDKYDLKVQPGWNVLKSNNDMTVALYQGQDLAILLVVPDCQYGQDQLIQMLTDKNGSLGQTNTFSWPQEIAPENIKTITFDVNAPPDQWVITGIDGQLQGNMQTKTFDRWNRNE